LALNIVVRFYTTWFCVLTFFLLEKTGFVTQTLFLVRFVKKGGIWTAARGRKPPDWKACLDARHDCDPVGGLRQHLSGSMQA